MRRPTGDQKVAGSTPAEVGNILSWRLIMKYFLQSFSPLIQEGQLLVSGERMCTILVNRLKDWACPVNVWLSKLTALDMTPLGWLGRKTSRQTKTSTSDSYILSLIHLVKWSQSQCTALPDSTEVHNDLMVVHLQWLNGSLQLLIHNLQCPYRKLFTALDVDSSFVCVEVLRPSQPNRVMSSAVSLPNHTFTGHA